MSTTARRPSRSRLHLLEHDRLGPGRNDTMRVNGQPERWLVAARLSRMSKRDRERGDALITGIQTQDQRSAEWAAAEGHVIVHVTRDKNVSGAIPPWERPELGPWLTDPRLLVQYDGIVAYDVGRLSRGGNYDVSWLRRWAEQHNKKLYVIKERLRWPDRRDGMLWAVEAERAEQERVDIAERISREVNALRDAGKLTGKPPFGFEVAGEKYDKRLVPTEIGRKYVPLIYQRVIDGWSGKRIAAWLNAEGVLRENSAWWQNTIGQLIRNPVYKGHRCEFVIVPPDEVEVVESDHVVRRPYVGQGDKIVRYRYGAKWREWPRLEYGKTIHRCEPLVDAAVWKRANEALETRTHRGYINPVTCAMLSEALFCPFCADTSGAPMYRITGTGRKSTGKSYSYYRCSGKGPARVSCRNLVKLEPVDAAVDLIMSTTFDVPVMEHRIFYGNEAQIANRLEEIRFEIRQLAVQDLPDDEYDTRLAELRAERDVVAATPVVEDRVELVETGETYLQVWEGLSVHERGHWLAEEGFQVYASKTEVRVVNGELSGVAAIEPMRSRKRRSAA